MNPALIALLVFVGGIVGLVLCFFAYLWVTGIYEQRKSSRREEESKRYWSARTALPMGEESVRRRGEHRARCDELKAAIQSGVCPKCKQTAFSGAEVPGLHVSAGGGGGGMSVDLKGECKACGHIVWEKEIL